MDTLGKELNISLCLPTDFPLAQPLSSLVRVEGRWALGGTEHRKARLTGKRVYRSDSTPSPKPFLPPQIALWGVSRSTPNSPRGKDGGKQEHTSYTLCALVQHCLWGLPLGYSFLKRTRVLQHRELNKRITMWGKVAKQLSLLT